jgi:carboxypeptidase C (cathepsin A)
MHPMKPVLAALAALALASCSGGGGGSPGSTGGTPTPPVPGGFTDPTRYSSAATASLANPQELAAVTRHQVVVGGTTLDYTATAGHLTALALADGAPEASFFYVAYTLDGADPATRPVTFFYNGGPGSASVWLHLGSFAPRRLVTHAPSTTLPMPFELADNAETLLDRSDLVFVDAVGTGLSEAVAPNVNGTFWSVDADAAVFRDFVRRYVAVNHREPSPKFLFGESYGTPRSAVLASLLESAGVALAGVVLQSSILDYNANCGVFDTPSISCARFLPSYAAAGAWLGLVQPPEPPAQLPAYMDQVRTLASGRYDPAVRAFLGGAPPPADLPGALAAATGLPAGYWSGHFNMDPAFFHLNLVPGSITGFYDARMVAPLGSALASEGDPSSSFYNPSFATTIVSYLTNDLRYTTPSSYVMSGNQLRAWDFSHAGRQFPDTVPDLAAAMALDPKLRVFSANGYHDIVTPFFQTEADLARLGPSPNVTVRFYQGGHMTYLDDTGRVAEKADLAAFYQEAAKSERVAMPVAPMASAAETPPPTAAMPPAVFETALRDPSLPEPLRHLAPAPPSHGKAFQDQVSERLRALFDAGAGREPGRLTREEARAAGLGFIVAHFDAIDAARRGWITFEDFERYLTERRADRPR